MSSPWLLHTNLRKVIPLNDFRFSFQLYFAISRASSLGGVAVRNSTMGVVRAVAQATDRQHTDLLSSASLCTIYR